LAGLPLARLALALLIAAPLCGAAGVARAQGAPIQLLPPRKAPAAPAAGPAPAGTPAAGASGGGGAATASSPGAAAPKGIEVDKLGGIDVDGIGALDSRQGGLGAELWRGSPRALVATLIAALPHAVPSPALRDLAHRLLLTSAAPPEGARGEGPSLLSLRARALAEMGDAAGLRALAAVIPASLSDEALARLRVESSLVDDDSKAACADIAGEIRQYGGAFWQKLQVFCQLLAHKPSEAELGVGLLHEEGEDKDAAFFSLVDALSGAKGIKVTRLEAATPLHLAMMRAAKLPLPEEVLRTPEPMVLRAVANSPNASPELRLSAAEHAALVGALAPEALLAVYDQAKVSEDDLKNALSEAQASYGPRARVLLYRAAKAQSVPTARAEAIQAALSLARSARVYDLAIAANLPLIDSLTPAPELAFFAPEAGRAYYYAGRSENAVRWLELLRLQGGSDAEASAAAARLWPYTRLAGPGGAAWVNDPYLAWRKADAATKTGDAKTGDAKLADDRAARLLGLFTALGSAVPAALWQPLYASAEVEPAAMPSVALWQGLGEAAAAGRRGETVLFALVAVGASAAGDANPVALERVIEALRRVGLEQEARRLAIEAAVANGV
jgi:hypothetical protein